MFSKNLQFFFSLAPEYIHVLVSEVFVPCYKKALGICVAPVRPFFSPSVRYTIFEINFVIVI